jgi:hypothetical protein
LHIPNDIPQFCSSLQQEISKDFSHVIVESVPCPPLSESPFNLAKDTLSGRSTIICDVGSKKNVELVKNCGKFSWEMDKIAQFVGVHDGLIIGAGATSPAHSTKINSELIPNTSINTGVVDNCKSKEAYVGENEECRLVDYNSTVFTGLGNFFISDCQSESDVIHVRAEVRIGDNNFISSIRKGLVTLYPEHQIGVGGVFVIESGRVKSHVMPCFPCHDLTSPQMVDSWLKFYEVEAPITCLSVVMSQEAEDFPLELRLEHTHFFSDRQDGGHYHYDVTPDTVVYNGYFAFAKQLFRIDPALVFTISEQPSEPESDEIVFL